MALSLSLSLAAPAGAVSVVPGRPAGWPAPHSFRVLPSPSGVHDVEILSRAGSGIRQRGSTTRDSDRSMVNTYGESLTCYRVRTYMVW
jgi:hypothetical protein